MWCFFFLVDNFTCEYKTMHHLISRDDKFVILNSSHNLLLVLIIVCAQDGNVVLYFLAFILNLCKYIPEVLEAGQMFLHSSYTGVTRF